jgi:hypothetical protein
MSTGLDSGFNQLGYRTDSVWLWGFNKRLGNATQRCNNSSLSITRYKLTFVKVVTVISVLNAL